MFYNEQLTIVFHNTEEYKMYSSVCTANICCMDISVNQQHFESMHMYCTVPLDMQVNTVFCFF